MAAQEQESVYTWGGTTEHVGKGVWKCTTPTLKDPNDGR